MEKINIRNATVLDIDVLCELEESSFDVALHQRISRRQFYYILNKANADLLVAQADHDIAGAIVIFYRKNARLGRIYSIAVFQKYQGKGVGQALFLEAQKIMIDKGLEALVLELRADEPKLRAFYEKMGCKFLKKLKHYYVDRIDGIKMYKSFYV